MYSVISAPTRVYQTFLWYLVCILVTCFHGVNRIEFYFMLGLCWIIELDNSINLGVSSNWVDSGRCSCWQKVSYPDQEHAVCFSEGESVKWAYLIEKWHQDTREYNHNQKNQNLGSLFMFLLLIHLFSCRWPWTASLGGEGVYGQKQPCQVLQRDLSGVSRGNLSVGTSCFP